MNLTAYPDRSSWLAARRIGASDIAAILGVSPYATEWSVWARLSGQPLPDEANDDMRRGTRWQPWVLECYRQETGLAVTDAPEHSLCVGPEPWATASPDGICPDGGLLEAKTDRHPEGWGAPGTIEAWDDGAERIVRPDYALQCYWQAWVCDAPYVDLAVLLPFFELRVYRLMRDALTERQIVAAIREWYHVHITLGEMPDVDGSDGCAAWLHARFPGPDSGRIRAPSPVEAMLVSALHEATARKVRAEADEKELKAQIRLAIGDDHGIGVEGGERVTVVRARGRSSFDAAAFARDYPDLSAMYTREGTAFSYLRTAGFPRIDAPKPTKKRKTKYPVAPPDPTEPYPVDELFDRIARNAEEEV